MNDRTLMCIGGFPPYTDGDDMKKLLRPLIDKWGHNVMEERFPAVGRTCKILWRNPQVMWDGINNYKFQDEGSKLTYENNKVWVNVDLSFDERKSSKKLRLAMDILKAVGGSQEVLKPRWSSSEILRVTHSQDKGVLCKIDQASNTIVWEPLADKVIDPIHKIRIAAEFKEKLGNM